MEILGIVFWFLLFLLVILLLFFLVSIPLGHLAWKRRQRNYLRKQSKRTPLSDEEFCHRVGLEPSDVDLVHDIRHRLAHNGTYDPLRIYPDDDFADDFGWNYDAWDMIEDDYGPCGRGDIGEVLLEIVKRRKESEQANETPH